MTQHKRPASVTRSLQAICRQTPTVRRPALDDATRAELRHLAAVARRMLAADDLPRAWAALAGQKLR